MFPSTDQKSDLQAVKNALKPTEKKFPPHLCVFEALEELMPKM